MKIKLLLRSAEAEKETQSARERSSHDWKEESRRKELESFQ